MKKIFEVCCGSIEDAIVAKNYGADRIEFNSALELGGLTADLSSVIYIKKNIDIKLIAMIRSRCAGFIYNEIEFETMKAQAKLLLENNVDGIVFGSLNADKTVNTYQTNYMCALAHQYNKEFVFHKAIDECSDIKQGIKELIDLKVNRVLTSGGCKDVNAGLLIIKDLVNIYGNDIEILAGGSVNQSNILSLHHNGVTQFHSGCKMIVEDGSNYNGGQYIKVDKDKVLQYSNIIHKL